MGQTDRLTDCQIPWEEGAGEVTWRSSCTRVTQGHTQVTCLPRDMPCGRAVWLLMKNYGKGRVKEQSPQGQSISKPHGPCW